MYTIDFYSTILSSSNTINILYKKCNKLEDKINNTNYFINNIKRYGLNKQLANSLKVFHNESNLKRLLDSIELTNTKNIATSKEVISILNNNLNIYKNNLSSLKENIYSTSKVLASTLSDINSEVSSSLLYELTFNKDINTIIEVKNKLVNKLSCDISYESLANINNEEYKEDQTEIANEGIKEVATYIWEKIKKAFNWIVEKLSNLYNTVKKFITKLFSKFTKKDNSTIVSKTKLEKLIDLFKERKYEILDHPTLLNLVNLNENAINVIADTIKNDPTVFTDENVFKVLFDTNKLNKSNLSDTIINFLISKSNTINDIKLTFYEVTEWEQASFSGVFSGIPKVDAITEENAVVVYNKYYEIFQKYADVLTDSTKHIVEIVRKLSNTENPFSGISDTDILNRKFPDSNFGATLNVAGMNILNAYLRINSLVQTNNIQWMKMFRDVLSSFESIMEVQDNKRVEQKEIEIVQKALEESNPAGTIDGFKWFFIEDLGRSIDKVIKSVSDLRSAFGDFFDDDKIKHMKMFNAFCAYVPGLNKPILITSKAMKQNLSDEEFKFIMYHECGHARNGHQVNFMKVMQRYALSREKIPFSILIAVAQGGRNLHDELQADAYGIEHTSPEACITALSKLLELIFDSKFERFINKYFSDINRRIKFAKKWKETGEQPTLPKETFK